jgi:hypothetical protein
LVRGAGGAPSRQTQAKGKRAAHRDNRSDGMHGATQLKKLRKAKIKSNAS